MRKARNTSNKHRYLKNCIVAILLVFTTALSTLAFDSLETQAAATEWNFSYTGGVQTWTAPYNGTFAIEAYGAAGGSYGINPGGYGGKVASTFTLQAGDVLKIYNGSAGTGTSGGSNALGHNGGTGSNGSAGGGASTVITLTRNGNTYTILEAGGGGGANGNSGGSHGGTTTLSTSGNIGGSGFGGGGGGYIAGASGASIIQEDPFVWIPDMTVSNKQYNINASKVSGSYTYIGGASDSYGYTEKVDGVYSYMQLLKSGAINENFTGLASVSEGQVVQYRSVMDVHLDADYNGSTSYVSVVDQNMRVLYSLTLGQIANGYDIGTVNHSYKVLGSDSSGRAKWDYNFNITYTVPSGVTKIGVIQHVVSETPNTGSWSSGIYVPYFGVINAGYKSSGGSNYISTAFSAKDTSSESGINNGNGYTKITALHTHSYTSSITTAATCTTKGVRTYTCSCGDSYTEEIPALGHAWPTDYSYATNNGITNGLAYKNCTRCGTRLDSKWLNRIRVRYQNADGTYGSYSNVVNGYYYSGNTISWSRAADATYQYAGTSWTSTTAAKSVDITVYRNSYTLTLTKGTGISSVSGAGSKLYGSSVTIDATVKPGYTFKNWTGTLTTTTKNYTFNMPANAVTLTANATPNTNTPYKVNHYQMNLNDTNYTLRETENKTGTTDTKVTPPVKTYEGFTSPSTQTVTISGDGTTVVNYYYTRNQYTLTLNKGTGISAVSSSTYTYKYGSSVTIDATVKPGYTFKNWTGTLTTTTKNYTFNMPAKNVTLTANATPNTNTPYKVNHWVQKVTATSTEHNDTQYELVDTEDKTGTTDTKVTPPVKTYEGCISPSTQTVNINGDGSTVVNYYYTRTKVALDINGEYFSQLYDDTTDLCTFDVYINGIKVADDVTDYKNDQILYGSTWEVKDIKPVGGKHYYGVDVN